MLSSDASGLLHLTIHWPPWAQRTIRRSEPVETHLSMRQSRLDLKMEEIVPRPSLEKLL